MERLIDFSRAPVRLHKLVNDFTRSVEFLSGFVWMIVGLSLLIETDVFASSLGYRTLARYVSEGVAGTAVLLFGLLIWFAYFFGSIRLRRITMFAAFALYGFYATLFVVSGPSTGTAYYGLALADLWAYLRLRRIVD